MMTTAATLELRSTIHVPAKILSMKANLVQSDPAPLKRWQEEDLYHEILQSRRGRDLFVLHDGPPYANGNISITMDSRHQADIVRAFGQFVQDGSVCRGRGARNLNVESQLVCSSESLSSHCQRFGASCRKHRTV